MNPPVGTTVGPMPSPGLLGATSAYTYSGSAVTSPLDYVVLCLGLGITTAPPDCTAEEVDGPTVRFTAFGYPPLDTISSSDSTTSTLDVFVKGCVALGQGTHLKPFGQTRHPGFHLNVTKTVGG